MQESQKKTWHQPELMLISPGNINGGAAVLFKEHSNNGGNYYIKNGGGTIPVGKVTYDQYVHS